MMGFQILNKEPKINSECIIGAISIYLCTLKLGFGDVFSESLLIHLVVMICKCWIEQLIIALSNTASELAGASYS